MIEVRNFAQNETIIVKGDRAEKSSLSRQALLLFRSVKKSFWMREIVLERYQ